MAKPSTRLRTYGSAGARSCGGGGCIRSPPPHECVPTAANATDEKARSGLINQRWIVENVRPTPYFELTRFTSVTAGRSFAWFSKVNLTGSLKSAGKRYSFLLPALVCNTNEASEYTPSGASAPNGWHILTDVSEMRVSGTPPGPKA